MRRKAKKPQAYKRVIWFFSSARIKYSGCTERLAVLRKAELARLPATNFEPKQDFGSYPFHVWGCKAQGKMRFFKRRVAATLILALGGCALGLNGANLIGPS